MLLRAAAVAVLLFFGALLEELSFRGYPFQKLTEAFGAFWAVVFLSALFGAVHLGNPDAQGFLSWGFFNTLGVGLLFALARIRTGSLWFSVGLHFGWNLFQGAVFGLPVSGLRDFSTVVSATVHGSAALTGGGYGPEASATCTIVLVVALPLLVVLTSVAKYTAPSAWPRPQGRAHPGEEPRLRRRGIASGERDGLRIYQRLMDQGGHGQPPIYWLRGLKMGAGAAPDKGWFVTLHMRSCHVLG